MPKHYMVDGTENDGFILSGSGRNAPFAVFDVDAQDWLKGFHRFRIMATIRAAYHNLF